MLRFLISVPSLWRWFFSVAQTICDTDKPCLNGLNCSSNTSNPAQYNCDCGDWFKGKNCEGIRLLYNDLQSCYSLAAVWKPPFEIWNCSKLNCLNKRIEIIISVINSSQWICRLPRKAHSFIFIPLSQFVYSRVTTNPVWTEPPVPIVSLSLYWRPQREKLSR